MIRLFPLEKCDSEQILSLEPPLYPQKEVCPVPMGSVNDYTDFIKNCQTVGEAAIDRCNPLLFQKRDACELLSCFLDEIFFAAGENGLDPYLFFVYFILLTHRWTRNPLDPEFCRQIARPKDWFRALGCAADFFESFWRRCCRQDLEELGKSNSSGTCNHDRAHPGSAFSKELMDISERLRNFDLFDFNFSPNKASQWSSLQQRFDNRFWQIYRRHRRS